MSIDRDDPKLTAYALGEIEDARDREEIEACLAESGEARDLVAGVRATAASLGDALRSEPNFGLTEPGRRIIEARARHRPSRTWIWLGAAAALCGTGALVAGFLESRTPEGAVASSPPRYVEARRAPDPHGSDSASESIPQLTASERQSLKSLGYVGGGAGGKAPIGYMWSDVHRVQPPFDSEAYARIEGNDFLDVEKHPLSTFAVDVDTASYANVRRFLESGARPPLDAVRIEEMINYFDYDYPVPQDARPFSIHVEIADAPWRPEHRLLSIGLATRPVDAENRPPLNLVFLVDVSGSMEPPDKLPLLKRALRLLVERLDERDRIAIVVYAGASGLVLPPTSGADRTRVLAALERLEAGGSTNGGAGIQLAYDTAMDHLIPGGVNRVVLATDGDFNVGPASEGELTRLIEERRRSGVFLSVLGLGTGNYKDATLEQLADRGNGNYAYIDSLEEARKVLVEEMGGTLVAVAKDVKVQLELNPVEVSSYRLIGYENRLLRPEEFNDDAKDGGEIGAGHTVTALYELVPTRGGPDSPGVDPLKYQGRRSIRDVAQMGELLTVKLRYKDPDGDTSRLLERAVRDTRRSYAHASQDFKFQAAVAAFGMLLRDSPYRGNATVDGVLELARQGLGEDRHGYRADFLELVRTVRPLLKN